MSFVARYPLAIRILHWLIALHIIGLIALGWYMVDLTYYDRWYNSSLAQHRSFGMLALLLAVVFILWKLLASHHPDTSSLKSWEKIAAHSMHGVLFIVMLLIPVSGYLISSSAGGLFPFFGLLELPAMFAVNENLRDIAIQIHYYLAYITAILVLIHVVAALKHHFINRDDTLKRML